MGTDIEDILAYIIILNLLSESDMTGSEITEKFDEITDGENTGFDMVAGCFLEELCREKSVAEIPVIVPEKFEAKKCYCLTERGKKRYKQLIENYLFTKDTTDKVFDRLVKYRKVI